MDVSIDSTTFRDGAAVVVSYTAVGPIPANYSPGCKVCAGGIVRVGDQGHETVVGSWNEAVFTARSVCVDNTAMLAKTPGKQVFMFDGIRASLQFDFAGQYPSYIMNLKCSDGRCRSVSGTGLSATTLLG